MFSWTANKMRSTTFNSQFQRKAWAQTLINWSSSDRKKTTGTSKCLLSCAQIARWSCAEIGRSLSRLVTIVWSVQQKSELMCSGRQPVSMLSQTKASGLISMCKRWQWLNMTSGIILPKASPSCRSRKSQRSSHLPYQKDMTNSWEWYGCKKKTLSWK